jgi:hypothetical protein
LRSSYGLGDQIGVFPGLKISKFHKKCRIEYIINMGYSLNLFSVCLLLASVLYIFCIVLASRKLRFMNKIYRELDTKKLLILSVLTACILRLMTFIALITMDIENVQVAYNVNMNGRDGTNHGEHRYDRFYDGSMVVLFDLPNGIIVSTYVLLTIVWAECFLQSKLHTESNYKWKHRWLRAYMIFNSCLYSAQITAYLFLFLGFITPTKIEKILRIGSSAISLFAVVLVISLFFVMNVHFSVSLSDLIRPDLYNSYFLPIHCKPKLQFL